MANAIWTAYKESVRSAWTLFKLLFLLTLPLTSLPILIGVWSGVYFAFWYDRRINTNTDLWILGMKDLTDDWGVPGMTFRDFQDGKNDFHVLRLNFDDWASKLGFVQPLEYAENLDTPIDKFGILDTLMVDTGSLCGTPAPKEQWVYISDWAWPSVFEWDAAFDSAVQAAYIPSALNQTRLFYAKCDGVEGTAAFLCGIWGVKTPTLLHFYVEDSAPWPEDIDLGLTYSGSLSNLRPVTTRVIEFPLTDSYTALPSVVFPDPKEQMLAMMLGDSLWQQFDPWNGLEQYLRRFNNYMDDNFYDRNETFLYHLNKADIWMTKHVHKPLGLEEAASVVYQLCFPASVLFIQTCVLHPWHFVKHNFLAFIGYPKPGDWVLGDGSQKKWNIWDSMMGMSNALAEVLENARDNAGLGEGITAAESKTRTRLPNLEELMADLN